MARSSGRKGRPWRRIRQQVLAEHGGICHLCGHPGAGDVDHVTPRSKLPDGVHPEDPANLRPAHGALSPCRTCGRRCNTAKGDRQHVTRPPQSRAW